MTQRIFDVDNPQDVKDLFDILPDNIVKIKWQPTKKVGLFDNRGGMSSTELFCIAFHNQIEITRPVDETEWVGCLCWFSDYGDTSEYIGLLNAIDENRDNKYQMKNGSRFSLCRPVRRDEVKFVEDVE